jgi:hypothetical protein
MECVPSSTSKGAVLKGPINHLVRRALSSLNNSALSDSEMARAHPWLNVEELELWCSMQPRDCRHSLQVHARFADLCSTATRDEHAAALLHDVGKISSGLGWMLRVVATVVGSRGTRFTEYHNHAAVGAQMLQGISSQRTIALVAELVDDDVSRALYAADNI